jgi:hypothetical protein
VIVRRNGEDLAAVIPLRYLELVREILAQQEVERLAAQIDWQRAPKTLRPPQAWFEDDEDNPPPPRKMVEQTVPATRLDEVPAAGAAAAVLASRRRSPTS